MDRRNWSRWEDNKPKWLDENMRAKIPVEWIPQPEDKRDEIKKRQSMRRPSLLGSLTGNLASVAPAKERGARVEL